MADVFISYSHEGRDRQAAERLAQILEGRGLSVFWDHRITTGGRWDLTLERELDAARSVVVLWSRSSRDRDWVREEAMEGRQRGILVPAMLEDVKLPLGLRLVQAANLKDWEGTDDHPGLVSLIEAVERVKATGGTPPPWGPSELLGSGTHREIVTTLLQVSAAAALPFAGYYAALVPVSERSSASLPAALASIAALATVLAGLAANRWMPARWRVLSWAGIGLLASIVAIPSMGRFATKLMGATLEVAVRHGDRFEQERRVKGTELRSRAERYLSLHPELRGDDQRFVSDLGGMENVWTEASIESQWRSLTAGYVATVEIVVLAFFALTQALKAPLWRVPYTVSRGRATR